ncbi:MAG: glycosyltransferase family 2 protein [Clostridiales bacterium]|nr:glycosyltransferase family 2 protein [Clostridiales bacterium]
MEKILSVVIPVYNMEKYIRSCLESLLIEDILSDIEILIILDGSGDHSTDIAFEFAGKYPGTFRVIYKQNGGHGSAINTGVMMARGRYLKVLDSDDWVERAAFRNLVLFLRKTTADLVWNNYYWVHEGTGAVEIQYRDPFPWVSYGKVYDFFEIGDRTFIKMHSMTIRRELVLDTGIRIDEHCYYVDMEFAMYPIPLVKTVVFLDEYVYMYRIGRSGQSMMLERMRKNHRNHERVLNNLLDFYEDQKFRKASPSCLAYLERGIARVLSSHFKIYLSFPCSAQACQAMREMDERIRREYPEIYRKVENPGVWAIRKSGYLLYYPGHLCVRLRERKNAL